MGRDSTDEKFERELRDLLLTAFADGAEITGEWTMTTVPDATPDWRVTVERRDGDRFRGQDEEQSRGQDGEQLRGDGEVIRREGVRRQGTVVGESD